MARGFESKSVADQQEEFERGHRGGNTEDPATVLRRRKLELARSDVLRQLDLARAEAHKEMLRRALAALEDELGKIQPQ